MDIGGEARNIAIHEQSKIPVTVLTGFLGSGKTTRLNATLAAGSSRIAVIENEIGALSVDGSLVANVHDDGVIELTNGCLCCTGEVDLIGALEALAQRIEVRPFDRVVIETTGLADVGPVVSLLRDRDDELHRTFFLDAVVTVVDIASFGRWASASSGAAGPPLVWASGFGATSRPVEAEPSGPGRVAAAAVFWRQVALADRVLLSKADVASEEALAEARDAIAEVNPFAESAVAAATSPLLLEGPTNVAANHVKLVRVPQAARKVGGKVRLCGTPERPSHLEGVETLTIRLRADRPLQAERFRALSLSLLSGDTARDGYGDLGEAWRIKGLVSVSGTGPTVVQGVGDQVELDPWPPGLQGEPFVVVIGERFSREGIEAAFAACGNDADQPALS